MATRPERRLTYDDYVHFPEGQRWELIDGEAYVVPSPNRRHQQILGRLYILIADHLDRHGGGEAYVAPFDVVLDSSGDVVQPDIVFVTDERIDVLTDANIWGTPSWVIEILSDPRRDRKLKLSRYERFGIPEYWITDPDADRVEIYRLEDGRYAAPQTIRAPESASPLQPRGIAIDLNHLFRR